MNRQNLFPKFGFQSCNDNTASYLSWKNWLNWSSFLSAMRRMRLYLHVHKIQSCGYISHSSCF